MASEKITSCIVESGTSGNWTYWKYSDGTCDLVYLFSSHSASITTAKGNVYAEASEEELAYPFRVYHAIGNVTYRASSNANIPWVGCIAFFETNCGFRMFNPTSTNMTGTLRVPIHGHWK